MKRNIDRLSGEMFDVVVVGAGIYGACVARGLAIAGYRTALIEKNDFGHATSANSLKILHGGLRYLQYLDFRRIRESVSCRNELMRFSPHLSSSLSCLMPTRGYAMRNKQLMAAVLLFNDLLSLDRNKGFSRKLLLPRGRVVGKRKLLEVLPGIRGDDLTGAANWFDGLCENTERMVLEHLLEADSFGACLANYTMADVLDIENGQIAGVRATDQLTGKQFLVSGTLVVNAAGPWFSELLRRSGVDSHPVPWARATNIVVKKQLHPKCAVGIEGSSGDTYRATGGGGRKRLYFLVPWREYTMVGTNYTSFSGQPDNLQINLQDVDEIIHEVNLIYPRYELRRQDVTFVHSGLVPLANVPGGEGGDGVVVERKSLIIDHEKEDGQSGLISVKGVKYTTAPEAARKVLRLVRRKLGSAAGKSSVVNQDLCRENLRGCVALRERYVSYVERIRLYVARTNKDVVFDKYDLDGLSKIVQYFIQEEMAVNLSDVVLRRSGLGSAECPSGGILPQICSLMADELGWDLEEQGRQLREVDAVYAPLKDGLSAGF